MLIQMCLKYLSGEGSRSSVKHNLSEVCIGANFLMDSFNGMWMRVLQQHHIILVVRRTGNLAHNSQHKANPSE